jgi:hypothetical protein
MSEKKTPFVKFFSSVEGHLVSRLGSGTATSNNQMIGARREVMQDAKGHDTGEVKLVWTDEIAALTENEWELFSREYGQALADGSLVERSEDDYLAQQAAAARREAEYNASQGAKASKKKAPQTTAGKSTAQE